MSNDIKKFMVGVTEFFMTLAVIIVIVLIMYFIVGPFFLRVVEPSRHAFSQAEKEDTLDAYRIFISKYPSSNYADDATKRIIEIIKWQKARLRFHLNLTEYYGEARKYTARNDFLRNVQDTSFYFPIVIDYSVPSNLSYDGELKINLSGEPLSAYYSGSWKRGDHYTGARLNISVTAILRGKVVFSFQTQSEILPSDSVSSGQYLTPEAAPFSKALRENPYKSLLFYHFANLKEIQNIKPLLMAAQVHEEAIESLNMFDQNWRKREETLSEVDNIITNLSSGNTIIKIRLLGEIGDTRAVEPLIGIVSKEAKHILEEEKKGNSIYSEKYNAALEALNKITGKKYRDYPGWNDLWEKPTLKNNAFF